MKTKDLFKSLEAANQISKQTGMRFYIAVDFIDTKNGVTLCVKNINNTLSNSYRFHYWNEFAASIASEYTEDVCALVGKHRLARYDNGMFTLSNDEVCHGFALRFLIERE